MRHRHHGLNKNVGLILLSTKVLTRLSRQRIDGCFKLLANVILSNSAAVRFRRLFAAVHDAALPGTASG